MPSTFPGDARTYNPFLTGGAGSGSRYDTTVFSAGPVYDALTRKYVQGRQGLPYTGFLPGGGYSNAGIWQAESPPVAPAPPSADVLKNRAEGKPDDFPRLVTTVQQPEVAKVATAGLAALPAQAKETQTAFEKYRQEAQDEIDKAKASAPAAYDTTKTEAELRGANTRYEGASGDTLAKMEARNSEFKAAQGAALEARRVNVAQRLPAAMAAGDLAWDRAQQGLKSTELAQGPNTPISSSSGARTDRYNRYAREIYVPIALQNKDLEGGLISEGMGLNREYLGNDRTTMQFEQALNESFRGNTVATAQYLQNLRNQMRGLSQSEQAMLLSREAEMLGLGQRLRSGEITLAGMLAALEKSATDYTYHQPFDPSRIPPTGSFSPATPVRNYSPDGRNYATETGNGLPRSVSPQSPDPRSYRPEGGNPLFDSYYKTKADNLARFGPVRAPVPLFVPRGTNTFDNYSGVPDRGYGSVNGDWVGSGRPAGWQPTVPVTGGGEVPYEEFNRLADRGYL